ncbi:MAG: YlxR family protein [Chloroflexi bacterium]|nr:YlxR family protein [Chloroflexota bacterium]MBM3154703.1 YlxR family protein [Chloroflexota bacterium]MBM3175198.1 YlxR family protein [Chloroflexota bacterium]MBM4449957.1 YlxR family protein [Chloroflexota bacterium]
MKTSLYSNTKQQPARRKHIPQRTCVACRGTKANRELIRLVNNAGTVEIDPQRKKQGRGAYLCPFAQCWESGLKGNYLEHALRTKLTPEVRHTLAEFGKSLPER